MSEKSKSLTPEHDKRHSGNGLCVEISASYEYVESVTDTADDGLSLTWHGWALREAFLAGISYNQKEREGNE